MRLRPGTAAAERRLAAKAWIRPLAWEPPCAVGVALKKKKKTHTLTKELGGSDYPNFI